MEGEHMLNYELRDWYLSDIWSSWVAKGSVYNNPKFPDGTRIRTSEVVSITPRETDMVVATKNSTYVCKYIECLDSDLAFLGDTKLVPASNADGVRQRMLSYISERLSTEENRIFSSIPPELDCVVLVLTNLREFCFSRRLKRYNGVSSPIKGLPHLGMFQDSVLVIDQAAGIDLRYMPMAGVLKFYSWDAAHTPVYAYNTGNKVLHLEVGGKVYDLFPNVAPLRIE